MEIRKRIVWLTTCNVCSKSIQNHGSGRPKAFCSRQCKAQTRRLVGPRQPPKNRKSAEQKAQNYRNRRRVHLNEIRALVMNEKLRRGKCEWPEGCPLPELTADTLHAFDFDHRNPIDKKFALSKIRLQSVSAVIQEMKKCDLLCAYHHRIRTQRDHHQRLTKQSEHRLSLFD